MQGDGKSLSNDFGASESGALDSERGKRATFDRKTGEVHGSGSGAGGEGNPNEDHDKDPMAGAGAEPLKGPRKAVDAADRRSRPGRRSVTMDEGKGHPLPASGEARHNEIPEGLEKDKGLGQDSAEIATPNPRGVDPDGEPYRYDDLGRGPPADRGVDDTPDPEPGP